ncbi:MAG: hypothetical protein ABIT37_23785 [Luteolibacter sp.]
MKTMPHWNRVTCTAAGFLLAILAIPTASAQTEDHSTGTISDSSTSPSAPPDPNRHPGKLVAALRSTTPDATPRGEVSFSLSGNAINVNGRIEGLEPGKSYQLILPFPRETQSPNSPADSGKRPSEAGPPDSGRPHAGAPETAPPAAGIPDAGKPDGQSRSGAPGTGEGTSVTGNRGLKKTAEDVTSLSSDRILQTFTADAKGASNVSATLRLPDSANGLDSLVGSKLLLMRPAQAGQPEQPALVANGTVTAPDVKQPGPTESRPPAR